MYFYFHGEEIISLTICLIGVCVLFIYEETLHQSEENNDTEGSVQATQELNTLKDALSQNQGLFFSLYMK